MPLHHQSFLHYCVLIVAILTIAYLYRDKGAIEKATIIYDLGVKLWRFDFVTLVAVPPGTIHVELRTTHLLTLPPLVLYSQEPMRRILARCN